MWHWLCEMACVFGASFVLVKEIGVMAVSLPAAFVYR